MEDFPPTLTMQALVLATADKIALTVGLRFAIESNHHKQSIEITQCWWHFPAEVTSSRTKVLRLCLCLPDSIKVFLTANPSSSLELFFFFFHLFLLVPAAWNFKLKSCPSKTYALKESGLPCLKDITEQATLLLSRKPHFSSQIWFRDSHLI